MNALKLKKIDSEYRLEEVLLPHADLKINAAMTLYGKLYYCVYRTDFLDDYAPKNYLTILDKTFTPISHLSITAENGNEAFEDIRLLVYREKLMAVYTYLPKTETGWRWENGIGIAELDVETGTLRHQQSLRHLALQKHEKNYIPLIHDGDLFLVANLQPAFRMIKVIGDVGNFDFQVVPITGAVVDQWPYGELRGGTPYIPGPDKKSNWYYSFVHSSIYLPNGNYKSRYYFYTVLRFDPLTMEIQYIKHPLGYSKNEVEIPGQANWLLKSKKNISIKVVFPMGLVDVEEGLLLSYGKDDCVSRMKFYSWRFVEQLFINENSKAVLS